MTLYWPSTAGIAISWFTDPVPSGTNQYHFIFQHVVIQSWFFRLSTMLDLKLLLCYVYKVECLFKYFIKQLQVKIKILLPAESGMWSCLFQSWRWQVSQRWQQTASAKPQNHLQFLCWRLLIFDVLELLWMYQGHNDMFKMRRSLQSGRRFLWCWAWQVRGPWNVSVDIVSWRKRNTLLSLFFEIPTINDQVQRYRGDNQCNGDTRG